MTPSKVNDPLAFPRTSSALVPARVLLTTPSPVKILNTIERPFKSRTAPSFTFTLAEVLICDKPDPAILTVAPLSTSNATVLRAEVKALTSKAPDALSKTRTPDFTKAWPLFETEPPRVKVPEPSLIRRPDALVVENVPVKEVLVSLLPTLNKEEVKVKVPDPAKEPTF